MLVVVGRNRQSRRCGTLAEWAGNGRPHLVGPHLCPAKKAKHMARRFAVAALSVVLFTGADWTRFRGPEGREFPMLTGTPTRWSATENIVWTTPLPGFGASSPITLGDKVFLTCYTGYGQNQDDPGSGQP